MAIPTVFSQVLSLGHHETFHRLLVAILKKTLKLKPSLHEILQVISVTPFYKVPIPELFEQFNRVLRYFQWNRPTPRLTI
jgi:hypothetical protein